MFDLVLKGGRLIDPGQRKDGLFDVALADGRIARIAPDIDMKQAETTIPLNGLMVVPGLIDAHCHPAGSFTAHSVPTDDAGLNSGVLLVNDAGSAGPANFHVLVELLKGARTPVTFFLNLASCGLARDPEIAGVHDFDISWVKDVAAHHKSLIRGIKVRAMERASKIDADVVALAKKAAVELGLPLMVHIGEFRDRQAHDPLDDYSRRVVSLLEKGDILSHFMTWRPGGMVSENGTIYRELLEAKRRGVILDSSHGKNNFSFRVARILLDAGLLPDIITTDLSSMGRPFVQSLPVTMSKFLALGVPLEHVIRAVTVNAATALGLGDEAGSLEEGKPANITVLEQLDGMFDFFDGAAGNRIKGQILLEPRLALSKGVVQACNSFYQLPLKGLSATQL